MPRPSGEKVSHVGKVIPNPDSPSDHGRTGRPAPRRDAAECLTRLLDGAEAVFAERGYRGANVNEICARSKVGIGTFYNHFEHKRELLQRVCVERTVLLTTSLTADDLLDHDRLVSRLRLTTDDPLSAGVLRAWYEAVLEEPDIAAFHAHWRGSTIKHLAATVAEAQRRSPDTGPRLDASLIAWAMATLTRELAIHDRGSAPDVDGLARLFEELVFGPIRPSQVYAARSA